MAGFIPKEKLTAYQQWTLESFGDDSELTEGQARPPAARTTNAFRDAHIVSKEKLAAYQQWALESFGDDSELTEGQARPPAAHTTNASRKAQIIPKENLTAYERWELAAFDEQKRRVTDEYEDVILDFSPESGISITGTNEDVSVSDYAEEEKEDTPFIDDSVIAPAVVLPTAAEIEAMHEEARQQGYSEGYEAGKEEGLVEVRAIAARMDALLSSLPQALKEADQHVADQLLATAAELANQMVRQSLRIKPDIVLSVIKEAMDILNPGTEQPELFVHPDDAVLVHAYLNRHAFHNNWKITEDAALIPGGCRILLGSSEIDATMETRWRRVLASIGASQEWLDKMP